MKRHEDKGEMDVWSEKQSTLPSKIDRLIIEEAHHPWFENKRSFTSRELLDHLVYKVIPYEKTIILPTETPITAQTLPTLQKVGTTSQLVSDKDQMTVDENDQFKIDGKDELKRHEDKGEMDLWSEKQSTLLSKIDKMKGLTIEMTFECPGVDGDKCLEWYRGRIM